MAEILGALLDLLVSVCVTAIIIGGAYLIVTEVAIRLGGA